MKLTHKRIEKLTAQQEIDLPQYRERWRAVGLATEPIDADQARAAVHALYRAAGAIGPAAVLVLGSPMACFMGCIIGTIISSLGSDQSSALGDRLRGCIEHPFTGYLWDEFWLRDEFWPQLSDQLRRQPDRLTGQLENYLPRLAHELFDSEIRGQLAFRLLGQLVRRLHSPLVGQLESQLADHLRGQVLAQFIHEFGRDLFFELRLKFRGLLDENPYFAGGQDAFSIAFYDFCEHIGVRYEPATKARFEAYKTYTTTCGWMTAYKSVAFVSDRPAEIHFDAQSRLHRADGAAITFRDGWSVYAWHGLRVPAHLIEKRDQISPASIEAERNAELRRAALEIYGFERYLAQRDAQVIATDELHGQSRRLLEVTIAGEPVRIVEVINGSLELDGTRRKFLLGAARNAITGELAKTPAEAVANSYGIAPEHYFEQVRT